MAAYLISEEAESATTKGLTEHRLEVVLPDCYIPHLPTNNTHFMENIGKLDANFVRARNYMYGNRSAAHQQGCLAPRKLLIHILGSAKRVRSLHCPQAVNNRDASSPRMPFTAISPSRDVFAPPQSACLPQCGACRTAVNTAADGRSMP
jgi:hypothetical protein